MDGSGRITKRNRRFLKPIVPFNTQLRQQINPKALTQPNISNTGPTAVSREATTSLESNQRQTGQQSQPAGVKSPAIQVSAPVTQTVHMSDSDFDDGLTTAVRNVLSQGQPTVQDANNSHQNKGKRPEAGQGRAPLCPKGLSPPIRPTKRVKFPTKRFIQEY